MAQSHVVYSDLQPDATSTGTLFRPLRFWIAQRAPDRIHLRDSVVSNGGTVVPLEKNADVLIWDTIKLEQAPRGAITWRWIKDSIAAGELLDKEDYSTDTRPAAPNRSAPRPQGALKTVSSSRVPYTAEDDIILWNWVKHYERLGFKIRGNEIYDKLEEQVR